MSSLVRLLLLVMVLVFESRCQPLDGFGYELLMAKMESVENKLVKLPRNSIPMNEQRQLEALEQNSILLQTITKIYQRMGPSSCEGQPKSGRYNLTISSRIFEVYCEQDLYDGGWIVIQSRFNGSVDFYRNWTEYRNGFGNLDGEFWLGLQNIYRLTSSRNYELLVHLEAYDGQVAYARYQNFVIGNENEQYVLKSAGSYRETAGNSFVIGNRFSTFDQDNDTMDGENCARDRRGAWWYYDCTNSNLNGRYQNTVSNKGMYWDNFKKRQGLKVSKMMIREV